MRCQSLSLQASIACALRRRISVAHLMRSAPGSSSAKAPLCSVWKEEIPGFVSLSTEALRTPTISRSRIPPVADRLTRCVERSKARARTPPA